MSVEAIKDAIVGLSEPERKQLVDWMDELEEEAWDRQIARDFAHGGRGRHLLAEVTEDIAAGRTQALETFLAAAKAEPGNSG